jgi:hypothetical protein
MSITFEIYLGCLSISLVLTLLYWKRLDRNFRYLAWLIVVTSVVEALGTYRLMHKLNSHAMFHAYQPVEYALLCGYYGPLFQPAVRRLLRWSVLAFVGFCVANVVWFQPLHTPNSNSFMLEAVLLVGWSVYSLSRLLQRDELPPLWRVAEFWVNTGILFFYSGAFFLMGLLNYLMINNIALASKLYVINHFLNVILYGLYSVGILCRATQRTSSSSL